MLMLAFALLSIAFAAALILQHRTLSAAFDDLKVRAHQDSLTKLADRSRMMDEMSKAMAGTQPVACLFADLTGFKLVNDRLGHDAGDQVLTAFATVLRDTAPESALVARMGGDEFCILLVGAEQTDHANDLANEIAQQAVQLDDVTEALTPLSCNVGVARRNEDVVTAEQLLTAADHAMYEGKRDQRDVTVFDDRLAQRLTARASARADLADAISDEAFELFYQPKFEARSLDLVGAEALTRWPGKLGPAGSPAVFIGLAEETGLIRPLGEWALDTACDQIVRLRNLPIAVNVSGKQLVDPDFPRRVADRLIDKSIDPSLLELEITETVLVEHTKEAAEAITQLRRIGVRISLDDFGTRYSSLSYLQRFEFDTIKIDRSFIRDLTTSETRRSIVRAIVDLANGIGAKTVAEGAETHEQISVLQLLGCHEIQGYVLGVPLPAAKLEEMAGGGAAANVHPLASKIGA